MALRAASRLRALHSAVLHAPPAPAAYPPALFLPPGASAPALEVRGFALLGAISRAGQGRKGSRVGEAAVTAESGGWFVARSNGSGSSGGKSGSRSSSRSGGSRISGGSGRGKRVAGHGRSGGWAQGGGSDGRSGWRQGGGRTDSDRADGENRGVLRDGGGLSAEKEGEVARGPSLSRGVCPPRPERGGALERAERGETEGLGEGESKGEQRRGVAREGRRQGGTRVQGGRAEGGARGRRGGGEGDFHHWWGRKGKDAWQRGVGEGAIEKMQEAWEKGTWGGEKLGTWARKKLRQGYGWRAKAAVKEWEAMEERWLQEDRARLMAEFNVVWDERRGGGGGGERMVGGEVDGAEEKSVWGGVEGEGSDGAGMAGGEVEGGGEGAGGERERRGGRRRNKEFLRLTEGGAGEQVRGERMDKGDVSGGRGNSSSDSDTRDTGGEVSSDGTEGSSRTRERVYRPVEMDRAAFVRQFVVPGLRVPPASCGALVKQLAAAGCLLDWPRLKNVARVPGDGGDEVEERGKGGENGRGGRRGEEECMARVEVVGAVALPHGLPWHAHPPFSPPHHSSSPGRQASRILLLREDLLHSPTHMLPPVLKTILGVPSSPAGSHSVEHTACAMRAQDEHEPCRQGASQGREGERDGAPNGQRTHGGSSGEGGRGGGVEGAELVACAVTVGYEYWTADDILRHVLPPHVPVPTSFESVGHIAHLNLLDVHLPYKHLIAQVLLDKHKPRILSVVNKTAAIHEVYRTMKLELLAGSFRLVTTARESGLAFKVDFARVYWNSRLATERARLVSTFTSADVVCDVFAGVGPIAVAAAKRVKRVYANDLNPSALTFLAQNIIANRVDGKVEIFNLDGRDFIRHLLSLPRPVHMTRIVMNLPADAIEFLDVLKGAFPLGKWGTRTPPPMIHVYAFSKAADPELELSQRIAAALGQPVTGIDFHRVRLVAPSKWMLCCSFRLPPAVAFDSW
ncbi:unnamed protein product [Closterium sp. Yama58-4]|nr:unnamed protein product [Closterium sp. Yama58-4]